MLQLASLAITVRRDECLGHTITYARSVGVAPPWTESEQASERAHKKGN